MKIKSVLIAACWISVLSAFAQSNEWVWANPISATGSCFAESIITDDQHNSYMAGSFNHPITVGDTSFPAFTEMDTFIAKYDPDGKFCWASHIYSTGGFAPSVGYNKLENLDDSSFVIFGQFIGTLHISDQLLSSLGGWDTYVAKFSYGGELLKLYHIGGSWDESDHLLKADKIGNLYLTVQFNYGGYNSTVVFGNDTTFTVNQSSQFLAKFSSDLSLLWVCKYSCFYGFSWGGSLMTDDSGNVTLMIPDVPAAVTFNEDTLVTHSVYPAFFHKLSPGGIPLSFHEVPNHAINWSVLDSDHTIYTLGELWQHDTLVLGNDTIYSGNNYDLLLVRYDSLFNMQWYQHIKRGFPTWEVYTIHLTGAEIAIGANYETFIDICNYHFSPSYPSQNTFAFYNKDGTCTDAFTTKSNHTGVWGCGFRVNACNDLVLIGITGGETYFGNDTLNAPNGCFIAKFHHGSELLDLGPDTTVCGSIVLNGPPGCLAYQWNDSSNLSFLTINQTGRYSLKIITENYCHAEDSVFITVKPLPETELGNDTTITIHDSIVLMVPPGYESYLWNTGDTINSIVVNGNKFSPGTLQFNIQATLNDCESKDSVKITIRNSPGIIELERIKPIRIQPNPTHSEVSVEFTNVSRGKFTIEMLSLRGELVLKKQIEYDGGKNPVSLSLPEVKRGIYIISVTGEHQKFFEKLIVI